MAAMFLSISSVVAVSTAMLVGSIRIALLVFSYVAGFVLVDTVWLVLCAQVAVLPSAHHRGIVSSIRSIVGVVLALFAGYYLCWTDQLVLKIGKER